MNASIEQIIPNQADKVALIKHACNCPNSLNCDFSAKCAETKRILLHMHLCKRISDCVHCSEYRQLVEHINICDRFDCLICWPRINQIQQAFTFETQDLSNDMDELLKEFLPYLPTENINLNNTEMGQTTAYGRNYQHQPLQQQEFDRDQRIEEIRNSLQQVTYQIDRNDSASSREQNAMQSFKISNQPNDDRNYRLRMRIVLYMHAKKCSGCSNNLCQEVKKIIEHIDNCKLERNDINECNIPGCAKIRDALLHWKNCKDQECPICTHLRSN